MNQKTNNFSEEILKNVPQGLRNSIVDLMNQGILNHVFELNLNNKENFILKLYRDIRCLKEEALFSELRGYSLAKRKNIPTPKIYDFSDNPPYLLMEKIDGPSLRSVLLGGEIPSNKKIILIDELVKSIVKLANVRDTKSNNNSYINNLIISQQKLITDCNKTQIREDLKNLISHSHSILIKKIDNFSDNGYLIFLHGDLNPLNIFIKEDYSGIRAIIDWEKSHFGHHLEDIGSVTRSSYFGFSDYFLEAYSKRKPINFNQLNFFKIYSNLDFILHYILCKNLYNFNDDQKRKRYQTIFENHVNCLEELVINS